LKPANIMIDARGQVRITDFGLAALAAEIPLSDIRSGTPAYMSPEQKAGKEVTTRSDIYSLGLVLHEMFTGKQRKGTDTNPTEIVKDLDPAIERLILRCLEEEPKRRPAAPINVAMGLPGADPIAAALAAGETPSPEMVAASEEKEGFSPRTAILCFVGIVVSLLLGIWWAENLGFLSTVPLPLSPDVLAYNAQQFLGKIGYTTPPADSAWALNCCDRSNEEALRKMDPARRKEVLASHQPAILHFWYRQHLQAFPSGDGAYGRPTETSPPNSEPGMILVDLDATGRLLRLQVQPWTEQPTEAGVNWPALFAAAGLDFSSFAPVTPSGIPPMAVDAQLAWQGPYANLPDPVTIHAASWRGRPVLFEVQQPAASAPSNVFTGLLLLLFAPAMGVLAWRNWRSARWDRRGATVLIVLALGSALAAGRGTAALLLALAVGILYVGIEPFARRYWPDSLISWTRVCQGQGRSPLVASHILAGILAATVVNYLFLGAIGLFSPLPLTAPGEAAFSQVTPWVKLPWVLSNGMPNGMVFLTFVVLVRLAIRKLWVADLAAVILFNTVGAFSAFLGSMEQRALLAALMVGPSLVWVALMRRLGFLTVLTVWTVFAMLLTTLPPKVTGWMVRDTLPIHLLPVAIGAWALWVILSAQRSPSTESQTS